MVILEAIPDPPKNISLVILSCFHNDLQTFLPRFFSFRAYKSDLEAYISRTNRIYEIVGKHLQSYVLFPYMSNKNQVSRYSI